MPKEVIKYTCEYQCGAKAVGDKKRMISHEGRCWNNPDNKTCKTCKNEIYETDSDGFKYWIIRDCKIKQLSDLLDEVDDVVSHNNAMHKRPIYNCEYWNKDSDDGAELFANKLKAEILSEAEGTEHFPFFNKPRKIVEAVKETDGLPF